MDNNKRKILIICSIICGVLLLIFCWLVFTRSGRRVIYRLAGGYIYGGLGKDDEWEESSVIIPLDGTQANNRKNRNDSGSDDTGSGKNSGSFSTDNGDNSETVGNEAKTTPRILPDPRQEDYVSNYLLFGVEEIDGAKNTDSIMIASINTKDKTIKITSIMRDTYVETEEHGPSKINAIYAKSGAKAFVKVIEDYFRIKIDGYAYINFESFEKIIDTLGGIYIELGEEEAEYLNTTNYISNPKNRNVKPGLNLLNGNQALGYCRIRLVPTLDGTMDDFGRTIRHRRVIKAIFDQYKSKGLLELLRITNNILGYVKTNVSSEQIAKVIEDIVENKITKMDSKRLPVGGAFEAPVKYNGIKYPLIYDWDKNIIQLYEFIYLDTETEAEENLKKYK